MDDAEEGVDPVEVGVGGAGRGAGERRLAVGLENGGRTPEPGRECDGRVEVVGHGRERVGVGRVEVGREAIVAGSVGLGAEAGRLDGVAVALEVLGGVGERLAGQVEGLRVVARDERQPERERVERRGPVLPAAVLGGGRQVADGQEVALRLGHLLALDLEEAGVHPVAREGLAGECLGLRDLALVVREAEVLAAAVQVDGLAEVLLRHHRALEVPAGEAPAARLALDERRVPLHEVPGVLLPEREVARVALAVVADDLARALHQSLGVGVARELAVVREAGDVEVHAVGRLVGVAGRHERLDGQDLLADVLGGARPDVGLDQVEQVPVALERLGVVPGEVPDGLERLAVLRREGLRHLVLARAVGHVVLSEVPHVGHVGHVADRPAQRLGRAHDEVGREERPEVADVGVAVDRRAAAVEAEQRPPVWGVGDGCDSLDLAGQRVGEAERRGLGHRRGGRGAKLPSPAVSEEAGAVRTARLTTSAPTP